MAKGSRIYSVYLNFKAHTPQVTFFAHGTRLGNLIHNRTMPRHFSALGVAAVLMLCATKSVAIRPCPVLTMLSQVSVSIHDASPDRIAWAQALKLYPQSTEAEQEAILHFFLNHRDPQYRSHGIAIVGRFFEGEPLRKRLRSMLEDGDREVSGFAFDLYTEKDSKKLFALFRESDRALQGKILSSLERWRHAIQFPVEDEPILRSIFLDQRLPDATRAYALKGLIAIDAIPTPQVLRKQLSKKVGWENLLLPATIHIALQRQAMKRHKLSEDSLHYMTQLSLSHNAEISELAETALIYQFHFPRYLPMYNLVRTPARFFDVQKPTLAQLVPRRLSQRYLLGGKLAGKVIARFSTHQRLDLWQAAMKLNWSAAGFDYVPIEPILTWDQVVSQFELDERSIQNLKKLQETASQRGLQLVFSQVICGPDLKRTWNSYQGITDHPSVVTEIAQRIENHLEMNGIDHGDVHEGNFAIEASPTGESRVYLIDWTD